MAKKIVVDIGADGNVRAETFDMVGPECFDEVQKLMADLAEGVEIVEKKPDFFKSKLNTTTQVQNKRS